MQHISWSVPLPVKRLMKILRSSTPPLSTRLISSSPDRPSLRSRIKLKWICFFIFSILLQCGVLICVFHEGPVWQQTDVSVIWQWMPVQSSQHVDDFNDVASVNNNEWIQQLNSQLPTRLLSNHAAVAVNAPMLSSPTDHDRLIQSMMRYVKVQQSSCDLNKLIYVCASERLEGDEEQIDGHTLAGAESMLHALTLAVASRRTLHIDNSSCDYVGPTQDGLAFCCNYHHLFQPISACPHPLKTPESYVSPFMNQSSVVLYHSDEQCLNQPQIWQGISSQGISHGSLIVSKAIASYLLRPNAGLRAHLKRAQSRLASLPPSNSNLAFAPSPVAHRNHSGSFLSVHISTRTSQSDAEFQVPIPRWQATRDWFVPVRRPSVEHGERHVFISGTWSAMQDLRGRMPHLTFTMLSELETPVLDISLLPNSKWLLERVTEVLIHAQSRVHLGALTSAVTRLSTLLRRRDTSVVDIEGGFWSPGCFLTTHIYQSKPFGSRIRHAYHPSLNHLLGPVPAHEADKAAYKSIKSPLQLIVVVGTSNSGLEQFNKFLSEGLKVNTSSTLSTAFSSMFGGVHYSSEIYLSNRDRLVTLMRELSNQQLTSSSSQRVLIQHQRNHYQVEKSIAHFAQPSLLASIIDEFGLHIQLKVIATVRDPEMNLINLIIHQPLTSPPYMQYDEYPVYEAKIERDLTYQLNSEIQALDASIVGVFNFERIFQLACGLPEYQNLSQSDLLGCQAELIRLAQFLDFSPTFAWSKYFKWIQKIDDLTKQNINQRATQTTPVQSIFPHIKQLLTLSLFNQPVDLTVGYDERLTHHAAAIVRQTEESNRNANMSTSSTMLDYLHSRQKLSAAECAARPLLVFDGYVHWNESQQSINQTTDQSNNQATAARQLFDLIQSFSLALATGRVFVAPALNHTILQFIEPLSSCTLDSAGIKINSSGHLVDRETNLPISSNPLSAERVVVAHSHYVDFAFLAAFTPTYQPTDANNHAVTAIDVGSKAFVAAIAQYIITPHASIVAALESLRSSYAKQSTMTLLMPASPVLSLSLYESVVRSLITTHGIDRLVVAPAVSLFQGEPDHTYVAQFTINATINPLNLDPSLYPSASISLATQLLELLSHDQPNTLITTSNGNLACVHCLNESVLFKQFVVLLQTIDSQMVVGSQSSLESLLVNTLADPSIQQLQNRTQMHYYDIRGFQWLDSIIALNHANRARDRPVQSILPTTQPPILSNEPANSTIQANNQSITSRSIIPKTVYSSKVRFLFVASVEGTGHHFLRSLFNDLRSYDPAMDRLYHNQLRYDEWLSTVYWRGTSEHRPHSSITSLSALTQRINWTLSTHQSDNQSSHPPVYLLNTLRNGEVGMLSYPNEDPVDKLLSHINLPDLVELFESCGVDLRILVLTRAPLASLASTVNRGHALATAGPEGQLYYMSRVLSSSASVIQGQLEGIDRAFYRTVNLNQLTDQPRQHAQMLGDFIGIEHQKIYQSLLRQSQDHPLQSNTNWMTQMFDQSAYPMIHDHFLPSTNLPMYKGFDFSLQSINPPVNSQMCRSIQSMKLRDTPKQSFIMTSDDSYSHRFVRIIIEQLTGHFTASTLGRINLDSWPSSTINQPFALKMAWSAYHRVGAHMRSPSDRASDDPVFDGTSPPALIVIRNPLEMAFARAINRFADLPNFSERGYVEYIDTMHVIWSGTALQRMKLIMNEELNAAINQFQSLATFALPYLKRANPVPSVSYEDLLTDHTGKILRKLAESIGLNVDEKALQCLVSSFKRLNLPHSSMQIQLIDYPILSINASSIDHLLIRTGLSLVGTPSLPFIWPQLINQNDWNLFVSRIGRYASELMGSEKWKKYVEHVQNVINQFEATHPSTVGNLPIN